MSEHSRKNKFIDPVVGKLEVVGGGTENDKVFHSFGVQQKKDLNKETRNRATENW